MFFHQGLPDIVGDCFAVCHFLFAIKLCTNSWDSTELNQKDWRKTDSLLTKRKNIPLPARSLPVSFHFKSFLSFPNKTLTASFNKWLVCSCVERLPRSSMSWLDDVLSGTLRSQDNNVDRMSGQGGLHRFFYVLDESGSKATTAVGRGQIFHATQRLIWQLLTQRTGLEEVRHKPKKTKHT